MASTQGKRIFQVNLSISIVLILLTLSTLSLFAAFYLGMIAGKSMQRPPEVKVKDDDFSIDTPISEEDLRFFGLGERGKNQEPLDLQDINELKNKTDELSKITEIKKNNPLKTPKTPKTPKTKVPKIDYPKSSESEPKKVLGINPILPKIGDTKKTDSQIKVDVLYTIQVFASRNNKNAKKLVEKLKKDGFINSFIFKHSAGSKTLYRVRVGKVDLSETKNLAKKLQKLKYIDSVQVSRF